MGLESVVKGSITVEFEFLDMAHHIVFRMNMFYKQEQFSSSNERVERHYSVLVC
jgi:hypothetical protein